MQTSFITSAPAAFDPKKWIGSLAHAYTIHENENEYRFECVGCKHSLTIPKDMFDYGQVLGLVMHSTKCGGNPNGSYPGMQRPDFAASDHAAGHNQ